MLRHPRHTRIQPRASQSSSARQPSPSSLQQLDEDAKRALLGAVVPRKGGVVGGEQAADGDGVLGVGPVREAPGGIARCREEGVCVAWTDERWRRRAWAGWREVVVGGVGYRSITCGEAV